MSGKPAGKDSRSTQEDIVRQFQSAVALMCVIPLLAFAYLVGSTSGFGIFSKSWGFFAAAVVAVALSGVFSARLLVKRLAKRLAEASEMKSAFLRNVAHEAAT